MSIRADGADHRAVALHNVLYGLLYRPAGRLAFCTTVY